MGKYDRYWEMREGGPYDGEGGQEVFKCTGCGATTRPGEGFDGEPNPHRCHHDCRMDHGDWVNGKMTRGFRDNFDRIFPGAPGAGV